MKIGGNMNILGIDIGGTNIKYRLEDEIGEVLEQGLVPSEAKQGADKLLENIFKLCDKFQFDLLGVSTAGIIGKEGEIVFASDNIPNYSGVKLRQILNERYNIPVFVVNDIPASALAEYDGEEGDYYFLALGTGVGGIHVIDGKIVMGSLNQAGQIGALPNKDGTSDIDKSASTKGLERLAGMDGRTVFEKAKNKDECALAALNKWCEELVYVLGHIAGYVNPSKIVIGGGVSEQGQVLLDFINQKLDLIPFPYRKTFKLTTAKNKTYSGAIGAVKYAKEKYNGSFR